MNPYDFLAIRKIIEDDPEKENMNFQFKAVAISDEPFWSGGYPAGVRFAMALEFLDGPRSDSIGVIDALMDTDYSRSINELNEFLRGAREYLDR